MRQHGEYLSSVQRLAHLLEDSAQQPPAEGSPAALRLQSRLARRADHLLWYATVEGGHSGDQSEGERRDEHEGERMVRLHPAPEKPEGRAAEILPQDLQAWAEKIRDEASTLRHPHLLHTYGADASDTAAPSVITELPEGGCLLELVRHRGLLPLEEVCWIVAHTGRALAWLHSLGRCHTAVREENVFFTRTSAVVLYPPWGSPWEVSEASPNTGAEAEAAASLSAESGQAEDVRQLAAMTWRLLTGREPGEVMSRIPLRLACPEAPAAVVRILEEALDDPHLPGPSLVELLHVFRGAAPARCPELHSSAFEQFRGRLPAQARSAADTGRLRARRREGGRSRPDAECAPGERSRHRLRTGSVRDDTGRKIPVLSLERLRRRAEMRENRQSARGSVLTRRMGAGEYQEGDGRGRLVRMLPMLATVLLMLAGGGWLLQHAGHEEGLPADSPGQRQERISAASSTPSQEKRVRELLAQRDAALRERDLTAVAEYAVEGGELARSDAALIRQLHAEQVRWDQLQTEVIEVEAAEENSGEADDEKKGAVPALQVTVRMRGYAPEPEGAGDDQTEGAIQRIEIHPEGSSGSWRIRSVRLL